MLGQDQSSDIALLKVDPSGLTLHPLTLGSSKSLSVGDGLAVIGDPFQYSRSLSTGVVSGLDRTIGATNGFSIAHAIQTDASLNPGNSGGPVLDRQGRLVGIADQIATGGSTTDTSSGVGFAVPIDVVRSELLQLESGAQVSHAYLGISSGDATNGQGALVGAVQGGSPASAARLRRGDVVTAIDGSPVHGANDIVSAITSHRPGDRVSLSVAQGEVHVCDRRAARVLAARREVRADVGVGDRRVLQLQLLGAEKRSRTGGDDDQQERGRGAVMAHGAPIVGAP